MWKRDAFGRVNSVRSRPKARKAKSLGPSNDIGVPPEEILAAEVGQSPDVWRRWNNCDRDIATDLVNINATGLLGLGALTESAKHAAMRTGWTDTDRRDYWAGWLAAEMAVDGEPEGAVDWDVTRPLAEQWPWGRNAEHDARGDAMLDEVIRASEPVEQLITELPVAEPAPDWQERVHEECDKIDEELIAEVAYSPPGSVRDVDELIDESSIGQGLKNIRENGIDAELAVLDAELRLLEQRP